MNFSGVQIEQSATPTYSLVHGTRYFVPLTAADGHGQTQSADQNETLDPVGRCGIQHFDR
jgi:hypothetical protein